MRSSAAPESATAPISAARRSTTGPDAAVRRSSAASWNTTASPSAVSCTSHSIANPPATAARAAESEFSITPFVRSCRPRWAMGRPTSQSGAFGSPITGGC